MKKFILITFTLFCCGVFSQSFGQTIYSLEQALDAALDGSYTIKIARLNLESSRNNLEAVRMGLRTTVTTEFDLPRYNRALQSQFNTSLGTEEFYRIENTILEGRLFFNQPIVFTNGTFSLVGSLLGRDQVDANNLTRQDFFTDLSLRLVQPVFSFNSLSASLTRANINLSKTELLFNKTEQDIIYNVKAGFYNLYRAKQVLEITREKVAQSEISFQTASNKFKAGLLAEVEALQLEVDLAAAQNELLNAETNVKEAIDDFKILIGIPLSEKIDITGTLEYSPITLSPDSAIAAALLNRPELENLKSDITLQKLDKDEIDSQGSISGLITANYGVNNTAEQFKDAFSGLDENRSITFTLKIPVWDWGKNSLQTQAAEARIKIAELSYQETRERIIQEITGIYNRLEAAKARVDVLSKSVDVAQRSYDISVQRFNSGTITGFDLSQMQLRLTDAKINNLSALIDYNLALAEMQRRTLVIWK